MRPRPLPARLAAIVAVATAWPLVGCAQQFHEAEWPDLVTARQQDAIDRGWVPEFLPEDATNLRMRTESEVGTVVVVADLPVEVALPGCDERSTVPPPVAPAWFPDERNDPSSCGDGWHAARSDGRVALWHVPPPPEPTPTPT